MAETILVVVEQREGKLNRVSSETIAAAQAITSKTGWRIEAAVVGDDVTEVAAEVARNQLARVFLVQSPQLKAYTPDGFAAALKRLIGQTQPRLVLMPHTYQVRDFAPKLATAMDRVLISD